MHFGAIVSTRASTCRCSFADSDSEFVPGMQKAPDAQIHPANDVAFKLTEQERDGSPLLIHAAKSCVLLTSTAAEAAERALPSIYRGRVCVLLILALIPLRLAVWDAGTDVMRSAAWPFYLLNLLSDGIALLFGCPIVLGGVHGRCVRSGLFSPSMTGICSIACCDLVALVWIVVTSASLPAAPDAARLPAAAACRLSAWDYLVIASTALTSALGVSVWRIYVAMRETGLYPGASDGKRHEVSHLELFCEVEDAALVGEFVCGNAREPDREAPRGLE